MAESIIRDITYSRSGDTSPQGAETGVIGEKYAVGSNVYESLGGTEWRLINDSNTPILLRNFTNISKLNTDAGLKAYEIVEITDRGATSIVQYDEFRKINQVENKEGVRLDQWLCSDLSNNGGNTFNVDDEIKIKFKLREFTTGGVTTTYRGINIGGKRTGVRLVTSPSYPLFGSFASEIKDIELRDEKGDLVSPKYTDAVSGAMEFDTWYTGSAKVASIITSSSVIIEAPFDSESTLDVDSFEIRGESFDFQNIVDGTITGSLGTVFTWSDTLGLAGSEITYNRDDGNGVDYISSTSGSKFSQVRISPSGGIVTPQMYGAVGYGSINEGSPVDSTAAFQAAIDSPYDVFVPNGYYLISDTLKILGPKKIIGSNSTKSKNDYWSDASASILYQVNDVVSNPSDTPIDFIDVASDDVHIELSFDVTRATFDPTVLDYRRPSIIRHWCKENTIISGYIKISVQGDVETLKGENFGYDVSQVEGSTVRDDIVPAGDGEIHKLIFFINAVACHTVINWTDEAPYNTEGRSSNTNEFYMRIKSCKRSVYVTGIYGTDSVYDVNHQCARVLHPSEVYYPNVFAGSRESEFKIHNHDPGILPTGELPLADILLITGVDNELYVSTTSGVDEVGDTVEAGYGVTYYTSTNTQKPANFVTDGWYAASLVNIYVMTNNSTGNYVINDSFYYVPNYYERNFFNYKLKSSTPWIDNMTNFVMLEGYAPSGDRPFIAHLEDFLHRSDLIYNTSVEAFVNDGSYDFENELGVSSVSNPSLSSGSSVVTIDSDFTEKLFQSTGVDLSDITYESGFSDLNSDFVEIRIEGFTTSSKLRRLYTLFEGYELPRKVQIIRYNSGGGSVYTIHNLSDIKETNHVILGKYTGSEPNLSSIIIRLIGGTVGETVSLVRLQGQTEVLLEHTRPYITRAGGKYYGEIEVPSINVTGLEILSPSGLSPALSEEDTITKAAYLSGGGLPTNVISTNTGAAYFFNKDDVSSGVVGSGTVITVGSDEDEPYVIVTSDGTEAFSNGSANVGGYLSTSKRYRVSIDIRTIAGATNPRIGNWGGFDLFSNYKEIFNTEWKTYSFECNGANSNGTIRVYPVYNSFAVGEEIHIKNIRVIELGDYLENAGFVELSHLNKRMYGLSSAWTNSSIIVDTQITSGTAKVLYNAATEPTITQYHKNGSVTRVLNKGTQFLASTDLYICFECLNGEIVEYWYESLTATHIPSISTGTDLSLNSSGGTNYNVTTPSAAATFTPTNLVINGWALSLIAPVGSFPTVNNPLGGTTTVLLGDTFTAGKIYEMVLKSLDGINVDVKFIQRT